MIKVKELIIINEGVMVSKRDMSNPAFVEGMKLAVRDKTKGVRKDLGNMSGDVARGYRAVMDDKDGGGNSWWDRVNDKLTKRIADVGTTFFMKK